VHSAGFSAFGRAEIFDGKVSGLSDGLRFLLAGFPGFRTGSDFYWQAFRAFGRAQIFVSMVSEVSDGFRFLLAGFPNFQTGSNSCWQGFRSFGPAELLLYKYRNIIITFNTSK
jgi:hypothetical protein